MGFFARGRDDDPEQAEALASIEAGGIPRRARERLQALGAEGKLFTSGLSVNEFALLDRLGPQPLAQVMGASVVRPGWQYLPPLAAGQNVNYGPYWSPSSTADAWRNRYTEASASQVRAYLWQTPVVCQLDMLTDAWNLARRRALDRLAEEALQVGADAVVGVHLVRSDQDIGRGTIEYVVTGTAIRLQKSTADSGPALTDVSVQDYWRLIRAGHEPVGLVATTVVTFASPARTTRLRRVRTTIQNQELEEISRAFREAREAVRARIEGQVSDVQGTGAVGLEFSHSVHRAKLDLASSVAGPVRGWQRGRFGIPYFVSGHSDYARRGWVITMHAAGTAVRRASAQQPEPVKSAIRMGRG